ncbi:MAG: TonB-dependent receptor [Desulfobulbaceae bacterium]|nr:TonB-dependent receptor [Desulfobulbaceae bacterium]
MPRTFTPSFILFKVLLTIGILIPLSAQAEQPSHNIIMASLSLEELSDITIITAAKKEQHISHVAAAATVITHEQIRRYGYRTLGEALSRTSGMTTQSDRNYTYLGVRGFSLPGDYNTRILVLIDGHRSNNALYDQASMDEGFPIDIESIDRIEIVKGPGSSLWGSNALFAVVNVITRKGSNINGGRLITELGSQQHRKGFLEYGKLFNNGLTMSGAISGLASDGEKNIYFPEIDQPAFHNGLATNVDDETAYKGYLSLSYKDLGLLFAHSTRDKTVPSAAWDGAFNDPAAYTVDENTTLELHLNKDVDPDRNGRLFARVYHDQVDYYGDYPYHEDGGWDGTYIVNKDSGSDKQWGCEIRYTTTLTSDLTLTGGLEYVDVYEIKQQNYDAEPNYWLNLDTSNDQNSYTTKATYLQGEYSLSNTLRVIGGIRYDNYSTFGDKLSPRAALLYSPTLATTLKFLYGEAFRAPNDYERNYEDGFAMTGNANLKPETIHTWEIVGEYNYSQHTRLTASLFRFELHDLIGQGTAPSGLLQFQNNNDKIRSDGAELEIQTSLSNGFSSYANLACTKTKNLATNITLDNSPSFQAAAGLSLPVWSKRLYLSPEIRYMGKRTSSSTGDTLAATSLVNLSLTSGEFIDNIDFSLNIYNLFDKENRGSGAGEHYHYDPDTTQEIYFDIPQEGRTLRAQLSYHY